MLGSEHEKKTRKVNQQTEYKDYIFQPGTKGRTVGIGRLCRRIKQSSHEESTFELNLKR